MLTRDRHTTFVLVGMLGLNILTALCAVCSTYVYRSRFRAVSEDLATSIKVSEKASVDAASTALSLLDLVREGGYSVDDSQPLPSVVVGYGQTRSRNAIYIYRDLRDPDGIVRREFISRVPFQSK